MAESNSQPVICPCGFFGSAQTLGLCSKCFKESSELRDQRSIFTTSDLRSHNNTNSNNYNNTNNNIFNNDNYNNDVFNNTNRSTDDDDDDEDYDANLDITDLNSSSSLPSSSSSSSSLPPATIASPHTNPSYAMVSNLREEEEGEINKNINNSPFSNPFPSSSPPLSHSPPSKTPSTISPTQASLPLTPTNHNTTQINVDSTKITPATTSPTSPNNISDTTPSNTTNTTLTSSAIEKIDAIKSHDKDSIIKNSLPPPTIIQNQPTIHNQPTIKNKPSTQTQLTTQDQPTNSTTKTSKNRLIFSRTQSDSMIKNKRKHSEAFPEDKLEAATSGQSPTKYRKKCYVCNVKLDLALQTIGRCKCEFCFCSLHRLPEQHQCTYDHKESSRNEARAKMVVFKKHVGTALKRLDNDF